MAREKQRLKEYRKRLATVEKKLAEMGPLQKEAKGLKQVVAGLEAIVGEAEPSPEPKPQAVQPPPPKRRGGTLIGFLRELYKDGQRRTLAEVAEVLREQDDFRDAMPNRNTIANRHFDLKNEGYLRAVGRGTYELAASNGSAPSVEPGDAETTARASGVSPSAQVGLDDAPGGGLDQPAAGAQVTGATTGVGGRT